MGTFRANRYNGEWCAKCGDAPRIKHMPYCRTCANEYSRNYQKRRYNTEPAYRRNVRDRDRERKYGITEDQYTELWAQQGGVCAICLLEPEGRELSVDHCHDSNQVRGLLCSACNTGIGQLQHSPRLLERAVSYVRIAD